MMRMKQMGPWLLAAVLGLWVAVAGAADWVKTQNVRFAAGKSEATIKGSIQGYEVVDYTLRAKAGQQMQVMLSTRHGANYFNVLPPGSEAALFVGSSSGKDWQGVLPDDGEYRVRVYLMRSAARRNEKASYELRVGIAAGGDAKVSGTPYHATGTVPCSVGTDPKGSAQCAFGVIRRGPGKAEVRLAAPGYDIGHAKPEDLRVLHFDGAQVSGGDASVKVNATKHGDEWSVDVNGFNFYTVPEAVVDGG